MTPSAYSIREPSVLAALGKHLNRRRDVEIAGGRTRSCFFSLAIIYVSFGLVFDSARSWFRYPVPSYHLEDTSVTRSDR